MAEPNIITVTLPKRIREQLLASADDQHLSMERHAAEILTKAMSRPEWSDVAEVAALQAAVEKTEAERDRARSLAVRLEQENAALIDDMVALEPALGLIAKEMEDSARILRRAHRLTGLAVSKKATR